MSFQTNFLDLLSATSSPESDCGPSPRAQPVSLTISPSGRVPAHASLSARQAQAMGLLTIATSGRTGIGSSRSAALTQLWGSRLQVVTASLGSTLYRLTWKDRFTPAGRSIFALRASGHRISVSGFTCSGWPAPLTKDATSGPDYAVVNREAAGGYSLPTVAALSGWSTPQARDFKGAPTAGPQDRGAKAPPLNEQIRLAAWPTPLAADSRGSAGAALSKLKELPNCAMLAGWPTPVTTDAIKCGEVSARAGMMGLSEMMSGLRGPFAIRCAVQQTASGPVLTGSSVEILTAQSSGLLNPAHSAWLQGIPAELASCVAMAMRSISKSPRRSSKPSGPK